MDPDVFKHIDQLNQELKVAGMHPSQVESFVMPDQGDIFPHIELSGSPPLHFERLNARERADLRYEKWLASQKHK